MDKPIIEIKNLTKYYGKILAVENLNLQIQEGEIFGFLGPNGAGKTTTIRCMMDFIRPTSGTISILGMDSREQSAEIKKYVGFLAGDFNLYNKLSGQEHINFIEGFRGKTHVAKELIDRLNFNPKIKVKNLSKGNKQKLALILALMYEPKIIIMDEPTAGLDPILQNEIYEILGAMKKKGSTIFFSSHILSEVEKIADRVGLIKNGKLFNVESLEELAAKKMRDVEIKFKEKFDISDFRIPGVKKIEKINGGIKISHTGDINLLLRKLADFNITDVQISYASLEDIFLEFYKE